MADKDVMHSINPRDSAFARSISVQILRQIAPQLHTTAFLGGKERSYDEFVQLFADAGYFITCYNRLHLFTAIIEDKAATKGPS
ncbi:hypothetical protein SBRCBS47491_004730 [Sporothrix bragantina]|uniref:Uncharacterized protein n=1 Tax=Sporothrix bragantina TaxID=671064 RepID=A0ABP0BR13_9PEZI